MRCLKYSFCIIVLGVLRVLSAQELDVFVDSGACPGEGCDYCGLYVALSDVKVYEEPALTAKQLGEIAAGDTFVAKTG